jgi:hypothetical protein
VFFFKSICKDCERANAINYRNKNIEKAKLLNKRWRENNPNYKKEYNKKNKEKIDSYRREYESRLYVKIKKRISRAISHALKKQSILKLNPILTYLPYTIYELKQHLESQFENWMNWDNWGMYNASIWDDNDVSTWTWQIDHITPQADFLYEKMDDEGFIKCWSLSNLRPYSAKKNCIEGSSKVRHKKT